MMADGYGSGLGREKVVVQRLGGVDIETASMAIRRKKTRQRR